MPDAAKALIVIAAFLAVHAVKAADPASRMDWGAVGSVGPEPNIAPPVLDGAQLFATHCAMCHNPADLARHLQSSPDPDATRADMAAFLAGHGRCDSAADAAIIDYLASSSLR